MDLLLPERTTSEKFRLQQIAEILKRGTLEKVTAKHARTCSYWVFSGDRHCSCGRDQARADVESIAAAVTGPQTSKPITSRGNSR